MTLSLTGQYDLNEEISLMQEPLDSFIDYLRVEKPAFWRAVDKTIATNPDSFRRLAVPMVRWAAACLGDGFEKTLADGYAMFVSQVNKEQVLYEQRGSYTHDKFSDAFEAAYNDPEFMKLYHWGLYTANFAWDHHLQIYSYFVDQFLSRLDPDDGMLMEFGSGSGLWSILALRDRAQWRGWGVDISPTSVAIAQDFAGFADVSDTLEFMLGDALETPAPQPLDAAISTLLLEHLEEPHRLLEHICQQLKPKGVAFVCGALTAGSIDHIYEFRYESELALMAEAAGFRILSMLSSAPPEYPERYQFLPRSMAMVLQKRSHELW